MRDLEQAVERLEQVLSASPHHSPWPQRVRHQLGGLDEVLAVPAQHHGDPATEARAGHLDRERSELRRRAHRLSGLLDGPAEVEALRTQLFRLAADLAHHAQRVNDLAYDGVSMEVGGSE